MIKRIIVTGGRGRKFEERALVWDTLSRYHKIQNFDLIVQGGAPGVDDLARLWCFQNGVPCAQVDAQWAYYGRHRAGPIRNYWMATLFNIDAIFAYPGGNGTADMVQKAETIGLTVYKFEEEWLQQ